MDAETLPPVVEKSNVMSPSAASCDEIPATKQPNMSAQKRYLRAPDPSLGRTSTVAADFCSVGLLVPSS